MTNKVALLDADLICYRAAASCEPMSRKPEREPPHLAIQRMDEQLYRILASCGADTYHFYLSGGENFRKQLDPSYKANRKDQRIPEYLNACRDYGMEHWNGELTPGYEADDAIAMKMTELGDQAIAVSIDKDFQQLPGWHYNFVKDTLRYVDEDEANLFFWCQMLIGDKADNVVGVAGIGEVKSHRMLVTLSPDERRNTVYELYNDPIRFQNNLHLLRLLRTESEYNLIMEALHQNSIEEGQGPKPSAEST